ncbi:hypothetical protein LTR08_002072 [Meristemomyces frigidus]|nr:hypothetical protein LTR08_002072 [Meristemomyces frigidus]
MEDTHLSTPECNEPNAHYRALQDSQRRLKRWIQVLSVLLLVISLALLGAIGNLWAKHHNPGNAPLSLVPAMPTTRVTFERNNLFAAGSSVQSDQAWHYLSPDGDGFILVPNNTRQDYHLQPGKQTPQGEVYDISLFHQLHCLSNIRKQSLTLQAALGRDNWHEIYNVLLKHQEDHVYHCFDYIRQALMCAGDMTIEWPRTEPDGRRFAVDGWGITHECKSWEAIMDFMNENTVSKTF